MKKSVYVESSVISYLTSRPSNDLIKSARQAITDNWWQNQKDKFEVYVSELVELEISKGNPEAANLRLKVTEDIPNLDISSQAKEIAKELIKTKAVPENSTEDALHIAIATVHGVQFLLTWNFKHINNAEKKSKINHVLQELGYVPPILCSPEELGGSHD